jgi:N-acetylglucosaminyldiphosphoundecaprenol N-acetyl-beta-D-mannosaminyltransferase
MGRKKRIKQIKNKIKKEFTMNIMNYTIFTESLENVDLKKRQIINTINPHSYVTAKEDNKFHRALCASDILIPDGSGIVLAAKQLNKKDIKKIAGYNLHTFLLEKMNERGGRVFYMGASEKTLSQIERKLKKEYPHVIVDSYSPPFKDKFSERENSLIINKINNFNPDVLFVGMTAPKQEKWLYEHQEELKFTIASPIGAVFDFYADRISRPSMFWIDLHLEWLIRLVAEPKRLWKRNFISAPKFLFDIFLYKINYNQKLI